MSQQCTHGTPTGTCSVIFLTRSRWNMSMFVFVRIPVCWEDWKWKSKDKRNASKDFTLNLLTKTQKCTSKTNDANLQTREVICLRLWTVNALQFFDLGSLAGMKVSGFNLLHIRLKLSVKFFLEKASGSSADNQLLNEIKRSWKEVDPEWKIYFDFSQFSYGFAAQCVKVQPGP